MTYIINGNNLQLMDTIEMTYIINGNNKCQLMDTVEIMEVSVQLK